MGKEIEFLSPDGHRAYTRNPERMREWLSEDYIPAHKAAEEAVTAALGVDWRTVWRRHRPIMTTLDAGAARAFLGVEFDKLYTRTRPDGQWDVLGQNISERDSRDYPSVRVTIWTEEDMSRWEDFLRLRQYDEEAAARVQEAAAEQEEETENAYQEMAPATTSYTLPDGGVLMIDGGMATAQRLGCLDGPAVGTLEEALAGWCKWEKHQPARERVRSLGKWLRKTDISVSIDRLAEMLR